MARVLFLFIDGIGLGVDDPQINPFIRAGMPRLKAMLGGRSLTLASAPFEGRSVSLRSIDAGLGVKGLPQSATGQAVLLTGINIPAELGYHYGPKPDPQVAKYLGGPTLFSSAVAAGRKAALLNAYPPRYFEGIDSGKRLYSAIPLALTNAGLTLATRLDYYEGRALSADFTGEGWHSYLGYPDAPRFSPQEAGRRLADLARGYDFSLFEYWASDYAGHKQDMDWAVRQLEVLDEVLHGLIETWQEQDGLILLTSDHGNMEDLSTRKHTAAPVPLLLAGDREARTKFITSIEDLTGIFPAIAGYLGIG